jgi:hypothetical protein
MKKTILPIAVFLSFVTIVKAQTFKELVEKY